MSTNTVDAAISLLLALINNSAQISALIEKATSEGRKELSPEDWATVIALSDQSQARLEAAIQAAP